MACTQKPKRVAGFLNAAFLAGELSSLIISSARADDPEHQAQNTATTQTCTTMSIGGADGWEPITYIDSDGHQQGLSIDILHQYAK